jgi:predicted site-specific integrase-resolvase
MERQSKTGKISLMDEKEVSELLNIKLSTLRQWRSLNKGMKYYKLAGFVRYNIDDIYEFIESNVQNPKA